MTLNHIHIGTKDLKKSVEFYSNLFGFKKKFDHEPGIFLDNEAGFLIAIDPVDEIPVFPSWFHIGFCLNTESEVQKIYQKVKDCQPILQSGHSIQYLLNPEHILLQIQFQLLYQEE